MISESFGFNNMMLNPYELWLIGSTLQEKELLANPLMPVILIKKGISPEGIAKVNELRQQQAEFPSLSGAVHFGVGEPLENLVLIKLSPLDPVTGKAIEKPRVSGIKRPDGEIDRHNLEQYQLTEKSRRQILDMFPILSEGSKEMRG